MPKKKDPRGQRNPSADTEDQGPKATNRTTVAAYHCKQSQRLDKCRLPLEELDLLKCDNGLTAQHTGTAVLFQHLGNWIQQTAKLLAACINSIRGDSVLRFNIKL